MQTEFVSRTSLSCSPKRIREKAPAFFEKSTNERCIFEQPAGIHQRFFCISSALICRTRGDLSFLMVTSRPNLLFPHDSLFALLVRNSLTCLALQGFEETHRRRSTSQQPVTTSARGSAVQPLVNQTFCSSTSSNNTSFVRACEEMFKTIVYSALECQRGAWLARPLKCRHHVLPRVALSRRPPCALPTRPARCVSWCLTRQDKKMLLACRCFLKRFTTGD